MAGAATALFVLLAAVVVVHATAGEDRILILDVRAWATPALTAVMLALTLTSGKLAAPAALAIAGVLAAMSRQGTRVRAALSYAGLVVSGLALNALLKLAFHRPRPHGISPKLTAAGWYAFPSGDAMLAAIIYGGGAILLARRMRSRGARIVLIVLAIALVAADSIARVYLGAHWPTDVAAGMAAGAAWAAVWFMLPRVGSAATEVPRGAEPVGE